VTVRWCGSPLGIVSSSACDRGAAPLSPFIVYAPDGRDFGKGVPAFLLTAEIIAVESLRATSGTTGATLTPQTFVRALRTITDPPSAVRDVVNVSGPAYTNLIANAIRTIPNYQ
jgi:hypothetical protein